jgi:4-aminobutyrate--pyruvate transaminase
VVPPENYFPKLQEILTRHDILLIDDEVICGFGRTGNMFGAETVGMEPDTMSMAKALSSAYLPISAVAIPDKMFDAMVSQSEKIGVFGHGYTYSGHPVCAAVALRTLQLMEERSILEHVRAVAPTFQKRLKAFAEHPLVGEARGVGLLGACELVKDKETKQAFDPKAGVGLKAMSFGLEHGLIFRAMGDNCGFCPPLIIKEDEINLMFDRFEATLNDTEKWARSEGLL